MWAKIVYDGHGGSFASTYLQERLHINLAQALAANTRDEKQPLNDGVRKSILDTFRVTDQALLTAEGYSKDGSCAVVALVVDQLCWVAFAGKARSSCS